MAIKPKKLIDTALDLGKAAVSHGVGIAEKRLRGEDRYRPTDAPPSTPGTPAAKTTPSSRAA